MALERKKTLNVFKDAATAWGSYDEFPVGPKGTDPMPHLSRSRVPQPFFVRQRRRTRCSIQMAGHGEIQFRELEPARDARSCPATRCTFPPACRAASSPTGEVLQIRLKAEPPAREAVAWYCAALRRARARERARRADRAGRRGGARCKRSTPTQRCAPARSVATITSAGGARRHRLARRRRRAAQPTAEQRPMRALLFWRRTPRDASTAALDAARLRGGARGADDGGGRRTMPRRSSSADWDALGESAAPDLAARSRAPRARRSGARPRSLARGDGGGAGRRRGRRPGWPETRRA